MDDETRRRIEALEAQVAALAERLTAVETAERKMWTQQYPETPR
jgi:hypothetical protein